MGHEQGRDRVKVCALPPCRLVPPRPITLLAPLLPPCCLAAWLAGVMVLTSNRAPHELPRHGLHEVRGGCTGRACVRACTPVRDTVLDQLPAQSAPIHLPAHAHLPCALPACCAGHVLPLCGRPGCHVRRGARGQQGLPGAAAGAGPAARCHAPGRRATGWARAARRRPRPAAVGAAGQCAAAAGPRVLQPAGAAQQRAHAPRVARGHAGGCAGARGGACGVWEVAAGARRGWGGAALSLEPGLPGAPRSCTQLLLLPQHTCEQRSCTRAPQVHEAALGAARFQFRELCAALTGPTDFIALATTYHTVVIGDVPRMSMQVGVARASRLWAARRTT